MRRHHAGLSAISWILTLIVLTTLSAGAAAPTPTRPKSGAHGGPAVAPTKSPAGSHGASFDDAGVYADDFSDPGSGWQVWSAAESSAAYTPGGFVLSVTADNWAAWSVDEAIPALEDFRAEVDATLLGGASQNSFGLVARYVDDEHLIAFEITGQGYYRVAAAQGAGLIALVGWTASPAIQRAPTTNRLAVTFTGREIVFAANGQELTRVSDDAPQAGQIGLIASRFKSNRPEALRVSFTNLTVTPDVPEAQPAEPGSPAGPPPPRTPRVQPTIARPTATPVPPTPTRPKPTPTLKPKVVKLPPQPAPQGFGGTWNTNFGEMTLWVYNQSVDGEYAFKNGEILAALSPDGRSIDGTWHQEPTRHPPNDAGNLRFYLSDDGQSWTGTWGYGIGEGSYENGGVWTGTRISGAPVKPPPSWSAAPGALPHPGADWCKAKSIPGSYVVYFTYYQDQPNMCMLDKTGGPPLLPSPDNPLTLKGFNPQPGDHIYLDTDGPDKNRFFNLMWDCGTNPGAYSPCDFWSSSLWDLKTDIVVNQANQIGTLNLSWPDNWAGVRSGFEPRRYPGDPVFRLLIGAR